MAIFGPVKQIAKKAIASRRSVTARWRAMPDFIVVGAQKAGTSSLYSYLCQHPSILSATTKQVHYFDFHYQQGPLWYRKHFPLQSKLGALRPDGSRVCRTGEATPNYLIHPHAARRCHETLPQARLIFILRNPIDRAYSHYHHCLRGSLEDAGTFEEALDREPSRLEGEVEKMLHDETYHSEALQHHTYMMRGEYIHDIERWLEWYPREQLHFLSTEELLHDGPRQFSRIEEFLGLDAFAQVNWRKENVGSYSTMSDETRKQLNDHFRPFNERLFDFLGRRFSWEG